MKKATCLLTLICFLISMIISGCTDTNEQAALQSGTPSAEAPVDAVQLADFAPSQVDFFISAGYLICGESGHTSKGFVRPGYKITLQSRVEKETQVAAGGRVEFSIDGETVDRVPFFMEAYENYITVKTYYILPCGKYLSLAEGEQTPLHFEARVIPDEISIDPDESNNSGEMDTFVQGVGFEKNDPIAEASFISLKTNGNLGENIARPGYSISILTTFRGTGGNAETELFLYVDDRLISDKHIFLPKSGAESNYTFTYYVPWDCLGSLKIRAELENGSGAAIEIPVAAYDYALRDEDVFWNNLSGTAAGDSVDIKCRLNKDSEIDFGNALNAMRMVFVVNGVASKPVEVNGSSSGAPYMTDVQYLYRIPENCEWPLRVTVVADPGGLFVEKNENNNIANAVIPQSPDGSEEPNLSISADHLWYYPSEIVPGKDVQLFAAVYNASSSACGSLHAKFFVNGVQLDPNNSLYRSGLPGGQYLIYQEKWRVPDGLSTDPVFTVEVALGSGQTDSDSSDNQASATLERARPDLSVEDLRVVSTETDVLYARQDVWAFATIRNTGAAPVSAAEVVFELDGVDIGTKTVDLPAFGSVQVSIPFALPVVAAETPPAETITGLSGIQNAPRATGSATLNATVDPQNAIEENDESNNTAEPVELEIVTAGTQGVVYVHTRNIDGSNLEGVLASITAGGKTASATSDTSGYCTFTGVPFGTYEVEATKNGYNIPQPLEKELYEGNGYDYATLYMDNYSYVTGRVTAGSSGLPGVSVKVDGKNLETITNVNGEYTLKVPAGTSLLKFRKQSYGMQDASVTLSTGQTVTKDVAMAVTDLANVYGWVDGVYGQPLLGMKIEAVGADGTVIISTTTDAEGYYSLNVKTSAPEVWDIKIRASGQGLSTSRSLYLYQGLETQCYISFEPVEDENTSGEILSSAQCKVTPWAECASFPGTMFSNDYEVDAIYGMFDLDTFVIANDSVIGDLELNIDPDFWLYGGVESSWSPLDILDVNEIAGAALDVAGMILPLDIPLAVNFHSVARTKVWIKKIVIESDGVEVGEAVYPDTVGSYAYSPNAAVNWSNCRIKYYLNVVPEHNVANPMAGYGYDNVLIVWDPKEKDTEIKYYSVVRWDDNLGHNVYMDQD